MTPNSCSFCESRHSLGYLFQWADMRICKVCRDSVLTYLDQLGIVLSDQNPLVRELCQDSHMLDDAHWHYYNQATQLPGYILRVSY